MKVTFRGINKMIDVNKIEKLMSLMAKHGFDVVQAESSGEKYRLLEMLQTTLLIQQHLNLYCLIIQ